MNKVKFGLQNVYYALLTRNQEENGQVTVTYGKPKRLNGTVELSLEPQGSSEPFYAENIAYHSIDSNLGYEGTLTLALITDEFKKEIMGYVEDKNKVLFENKDAVFKPFALMFEFMGDAKKTRHILYNVNTSRSKVSGKTIGDKNEVETEELSLKATPCEETGMVKASCYEGTEQYNSWYTTVYKYVASSILGEMSISENTKSIKSKDKE